MSREPIDSETSQRMRVVSHLSWAKTLDRPARTAAARQASHYGRFLDQARRDNPEASEAQLQQIATSLRKAHYADMALKSAQARRRKGEQRRAARARQIAELTAETAGSDAQGAA